MKVQVITTFSSSNYNPQWELQLKIDRLRRKLKNSIFKCVNGNYYYKLYLEDSLYKEVLELKKSYGEEIDVVTVFEPEYTYDELEKAVAFIPQFEKIQLEEYGDDNLTHIQICQECGVSKFRDKFVANPDGKTKVLQNSIVVIKCGDQIDELYGISKFMFEQIKDKNIKNSFKPIYSKRAKEPFGYAFFSKKTISLYNNNYVYEKCSKCGEIYAEEKNCIEGYEEFYVDKKPDFIDGEVLYSNQYYYGNQMCIVSPKLYKWIKSEVKDALFTPVFIR